MPHRYEHHFRVRSYEVGADAEVRPDTYLNYLEEAGVNASSSLGFDLDWYTTHKRLWVARKLFIHYYKPARLNDELKLTTWISQTRRVQAFREYELCRAGDNEMLLRARHLWVFLDSVTMLPTRMPAEFAEKYVPTEDEAVPLIDMAGLEPVDSQSLITFQVEQRVRYYETDQNRHVNNAVYIHWAEQAMIEALRAHGWPPDRWQNGPMQRLGRETDYLRSLQDDEAYQITTSLEAAGTDRLVWATEIAYVGTGQLIAQDRLLCRISPELRQALLG